MSSPTKPAQGMGIPPKQAAHLSAPRPATIMDATAAALRELRGLGLGAIVGGFYAGMITKTPVVGVGVFLLILGASVPGIYRKLHGAASYTINTAFNYIGLGKLNEASKLLDEAEAHPRFMWVRRLVDIQRAIIAMRRGNMAEAKDRLDSAIAWPLGLLERENSLYQIEGAHALRAFARASLGERDGALEDIAAVRSRGNASPDALAKVALAEALILERAGERGRLKELLDRDESLLLEHTHPRERAIVRGLQRMLRASAKASIYRQSAPMEDARADEEEPALADWVAKIAPDVAPFVRVPRRPTDGSPALIAASVAEAPKLAAMRAVAEAHTSRARPRRSAAWMLAPLAVIGVLLIISLRVAIKALGRASGAMSDLVPAGSGVNPLLWLLPLLVISIAGVAVLGIAQAKRVGKRFAAKRGGGGGGGARVDLRPDGEATRGLTALAMGASDVAAAQARLVLAGNAERRGDFEAVITECRLGIGRLDDPRSRAEADILYPDLISLCAFALAASGRSDEADAELALLPPTYPHHARAVFRVRLVQCLRRRDLERAALWVDQGAADLPLSIREELLADLVRALHSPSQAGAGEIERLKDELRRSEERRRWLDAAAPGIVAAFEQGGQGEADTDEPVDRAQPPVAARVRVEAPRGAGSSGAAVDPHHAAELEARAEVEAEEAAVGAGWAKRQDL